MKFRVAAFFLILFACIASAHAFTPDELVKLKKAGLGEKLIVQLFQMGYADTSSLLKLKEAGFSDDAILTFAEAGIKHDEPGKTSPLQSPKVADLTAEAKARIVWYLIYNGKPVVRNKKDIDKAVVSLTGKTLSIAWQPPQGVKAFLSALKTEPFPSPFIWDIAPSDSVEVREGEPLQVILKSSPSKLGRPKSGENGYYELCLSTTDPALIEQMKGFR
ncbi:MAG: hypothetical protein HYS23_00390 [Geobacter sp.]|nr:hypothetical protein [Geobacter sp.]